MDTFILLIPFAVIAVGVDCGLLMLHAKLTEQLEAPAAIVHEEGLERVPDITLTVTLLV